MLIITPLVVLVPYIIGHFPTFIFKKQARAHNVTNFILTILSYQVTAFLRILHEQTIEHSIELNGFYSVQY